MEDKNLQYIKQGKTGCVFATIMAREPSKIGWQRIFYPTTHWEHQVDKDSCIVSLIFPEHWDQKSVRSFALLNGFYLEDVGEGLEGLRYKTDAGVSWVQYFGPDSHVKTRQSPQPELLFTLKLSGKQYVKVGFKGVLHLAHASVEHIKEKNLDKIWEACFKRTKKILGYEPTISEGAKTTFKR
ncbi:hypothetical protein Phi4:1_gp004 [Cellulophaga phage phi4:1]|uniref:Uncharacterized protein n=5 Tax=Lightbulbvirus TaxID=1918522 RepID=A0A0S2MWH0_9CAUD|nr:hypothetical protein Phi4:1_gp004 [Cellulophaga phage phi4:1]YP_008241499.1 hypothetical protein Phi17:2_gp004 [Cellulophaga phage phi17:2]ALO80013.1 hypothetical protein Phi4113_004 [Cellulophaga phage phi4:1_13]ALO80210.1 hypothetical protein Phi4118_004 [Cellulophaga phage phi4:1_18]ALO80407.1 hypothetical protein Phi17218_004 [Cellulophaga phage phi17:2_18]AGO47537.1 hypothetical protein Phi17:2_gp004 [Cellulophaga phage phi17:2]AGO49417.1 hypothetical protein Phi4:1_gp004 [Cellulophag